MINFNMPTVVGSEKDYVSQAIKSKKISGNGYFTKKCEHWFEEKIGCAKTLLTPSCTSALEISAMLVGIQPGDEVIMPSFTFVSTANAFVLRGAKIIFVDIHPDTMNIDENKIEEAITEKTKAIVPVHYAGVGCEMDKIMSIAAKYDLTVIEDAAQGIIGSYKGKALGSIGHIGAFSFHETKNITSGGEGGLLILNDKQLISKAEIFREKGTNRNLFLRGQVDKYTWIDIGSSFLASELQAAFLWGQLEQANHITKSRLRTWNIYYDAFKPFHDLHKVTLQQIPEHCDHNGHIFSLKLKDIKQRTNFINHLKSSEIMAAFHYVPLHSSPAGQKYSIFCGEDQYTTNESERLVRLPIFYGMTKEEQRKIIESSIDFLQKI